MPKLHKSEGDINISPLREAWQKSHIDSASQALLDEDARYFLKQSLSTPCLNTMRTGDGIYIEDMQGRRYMDFHGNNVHQVGFANPDVIQAIKDQLDSLSFCTRRYANRVAVDLARKLTEIAPGDLGKVLFCPGGAEAVGGVVVVRYGYNPLDAIKNVKKKIEEISPGLPQKTLSDGTVSQVTIVPLSL